MTEQLTGPPYPALPGAGSNALGIAAVGTTLQIGDIAPFDWRQTILSQYANSPIICGLIERFADALDQTENISNFFDLVFNLDTCEGHGLDCWGRIVGVNRIVKVQTGKFLGFEEAGAGSVDPFNQSPFFIGTPATSSYSLTDLIYRRLIIAKAMANITDGSIPSINAILLYLFPNRGNCYVSDGLEIPSYFGFEEARNAVPFNQAPFYVGEPLPTMTINYVFDFALSASEIAIVQYSGVLPKPCGVAASIIVQGVNIGPMAAAVF